MLDTVDKRNDTLTPWDILGLPCSKNSSYYVSLEVTEVDAASVCILCFAFVAAFALVSNP